MSTTVDLGKITASVTVGTTTTGAAGTNASVTNVGTTQDAVLNFTIPRGAQGVQGPQGSTGPAGPAGPTGPQGPMGDVAVITPEQQAAFTMYSVPGQNTDGPMTQKAVTDNFAEIKNDNDADFDIADETGYVIARFENGDFKVKNFDSSKVKIETDDDEHADLDIADEDNNVLVRLDGGHIKTKFFNSGRLFPYKRRNFFTHEVDVTNYLATDADYSAESVNTYETIKMYDDNCVLYLPYTYTQNGEPTKLIIYCKHGDTYITEDVGSDDILGSGSMGKIFRYMLHLGYGILAADGVPDGWKEELGLLERAVGNYVAVESTIRAFDYVKNNYNVDANNVFIFGYSQGGMYAQNVIDNSNIPFAAAAQLSPVSSMRYQQWDNIGNVSQSFPWTYPSRYNIAKIFDFPEFTTDEELAALQYDYGKTVGYDPWSRNVDDMYTGFAQGTTYGNNLWGLPSGTSLDDITMKKHIKCPLKIWGAQNDNVIGSDIWKVFIKAIKNSGQAADIQLYSTGQHNPVALQSAIGTFVENGDTLNLYPIAVDVASWFYRFGGYPLKSFDYNN